MISKATPESAVDLLVISPSLSDTERYATSLRNVGLAVHAIRIEDAEELAEHLVKQQFDLILLCNNNSSDVASAMEAYDSADTDASLILITDVPNPELTLQAMQKGARDSVLKNDLQHLQLVAGREVSGLRTSRELVAARRQLQEAEERCNTLIQSSRDAIAYVHEGMYVVVNPAYLEMFGFMDMEEIEGLPMMDMVAPDQHRKLKFFLRSLDQSSNDTSQLEVTCQSSDSTRFDALLEFSNASVDGEPCTQIIIRNQGNSKELEQKIQLLYSQDTQTELFNRQYFMEKLEKNINLPEHTGKQSSLLYITLDDFPELRDNIGLAASDCVLKETAELFSKIIGPDDILARFGDHTFTVLTNNPMLIGDDSLSQALCTAVETHDFSSSGKLINPSCSIGIASCTGQTNTPQEIINSAFNACKSAAEDSENRVIFFQPGVPGSASFENNDSESDITRLIKKSLEQDRFHLVYQPVVSLQGDTRENYAVLTRLLDDDDEEVLPKDFVDQALQDGLMGAIDRRVIKHAIKELASQRQEGRKTIFFITLSAVSVQDESLLLWICDCLRDSNAKGGWVCFQIRDEDIRKHINAVKTLVEGLKKIKCQLAIDRYGVLPKPESPLKHLRFDYAKLDSSFMKNLATSQEQQDSLDTINKLIQSYDVKSIATAVEDANSLAILWTVGINYIQGYFLQEPSESISYDFSNAGVEH